MNSLQAPIKLATKDYTLGTSVPTALLSGFGRTSTISDVSPLLKWIELKILSQKDCLSYGTKKLPTNSQQICSLEKTGRGSCHVSVLFYFVLDTFKTCRILFVLLSGTRNELSEILIKNILSLRATAAVLSS